MNTKTIDGSTYARMLRGGIAILAKHRDELNALNVFPVSDGDTGTNMLCTMEGGLSELASERSDSIGKASESFSKGALLSARGNSGVILSQIFSGINEGIKELDTANAAELASAFRKGIERSYSSVQNPTEGTILTVFRESTVYAADRLSEDSAVEDFLRMHVEEAKRSLAATTDILPVLAEAGVVDSGAAGYLYIAEGMYKALSGVELSYQPTEANERQLPRIERFTRDSVLEYGYCTELLIRLTTNKIDPDAFDINTALDALKALGGESIVAYKQDDILKIHVHTFSPGDVFNEMQRFGEFLTVKVENMSLGHSEDDDVAKKRQDGKKSGKKFSVVAVASGEGMSALFTQMGVDRLINGGQTVNPSIEEFIGAFEDCATDDIIVLPNNKNVILAARQAAKIYDRARVHVIESKSFAQGYSALSVITPGITDIDALLKSAERAADGVIDGEITRAVRSTTVKGVNIEHGDYIAISRGEVVSVSKTPEDALLKMLEQEDVDLCEIITVFVGRGVTEDQRASLTEKLKASYDECEISVYNGGQDVYDYIVAIE